MVMSANRQALRSLLALACVIVVSLGRATAAVAAIDGGFTVSQAQPGDRVTLTAQGPAGQTESVYMISTADLERQIARFGRQVCNTSGPYALGSFTWNGGIGSLTPLNPLAALLLVGAPGVAIAVTSRLTRRPA
jgi:hypothetical protein